MKYLFQQGVPNTGMIRENSRGFPAGTKNGSWWSKTANVERGGMCWERDPPIHAAPTRQVEPNQSVHMPVFTKEKRNSAVPYSESKVQQLVCLTCSAPMCEGKHMHVTKKRNCFQEFHSREYHKQWYFGLVLNFSWYCAEWGKGLPKFNLPTCLKFLSQL